MTTVKSCGEGRVVKKLLSLFHLSFLPASGPLALFVLRVWIGLSMLLLHGVGKAQNLGADVRGFPDPLGIGAQASHALTVFGEAAASILLIMGIFTRFAALTGIITMGVAFFMVKKAMLSGPQSGELAYLYLGCYVVLFIAGPGRFSLDQRAGTPS